MYKLIFMKIKFFVLLFLPYFLQALPFESREFAVTGPSIYLQETAKRIHSKGGNVVDMAVAGAFTLAVVTPFYVSLGAGGFALVDMGDEVQALDFREMAPQKMHKDYYISSADKKGKSSVLGGSAVGVPGFTMGMWELHKKYGKLPWKVLFKEAVRLSEKGYRVGTEWVKITKSISHLDYGMSAFFHKNRPYQAGELFKQKKLTSALRKVRDKNVKGFYEGRVAKDVVKAVVQYGGDMTLEDLKKYKTRWLKPVQKRIYGLYSL